MKKNFPPKPIMSLFKEKSTDLILGQNFLYLELLKRTNVKIATTIVGIEDIAKAKYTSDDWENLVKRKIANNDNACPIITMREQYAGLWSAINIMVETLNTKFTQKNNSIIANVS
jgi:hypothetical protein